MSTAGLRGQLYGVCLGAGAAVTEYMRAGQGVAAREVVAPQTPVTMETARQSHPRYGSLDKCRRFCREFSS
jgi:hypothetical protein